MPFLGRQSLLMVADIQLPEKYCVGCRKGQSRERGCEEMEKIKRRKTYAHRTGLSSPDGNMKCENYSLKGS